MNLVRIGKIVLNFDLVTAVLQDESEGSSPEGLIVYFANERKHVFTGDDAEGLKAFLDKTVKNAVKPQKEGF